MSASTPTNDTFPIGVCVLPEPQQNAARTWSYPDYVHEIFAHAGICYRTVQLDKLAARIPSLRVLVTVGDRELPLEAQQRLRDFLDAGGAWVSIGGTCGMHDVLGAAKAPGFQGWGGGNRTLGEGYLAPTDAGKNHPMLQHFPRPLHFFNGLAVQSTGATVLATALDAHGRETPDPVLLENKVGTNGGRAVLVPVDLTGTVVLIQQGVGVTRDRTPSRDGNAPTSDGVLKSGDGAVLDWIFDREPLPGATHINAYTQPVADQWRELLIRGVLHLAREMDVPVPVLWLYPRNLPAVGHLSHDTDGNDPKLAQRLLDVMKEAGARGTWCVIAPGYEKSLIARIREAGHELAMHYDAMTPGLPWGREQFEKQWSFLNDLLDGDIVSNKNHYTRWEGDTEFFDWCVARGIQMEQSKGASKTGEAPFNFGTCHPHRPVRMGGEFIDILELPTMTQDLTVFAPEAMGDAVLAAALKHHGVCHLLYHPAHFAKEAVCQALANSVRKGKEKGLEWWTAREINAWERARRKVTWESYDGGTNGGAGPSAALTCGAELKDATVLWLSTKTLPTGGQTAQRWGFDFTTKTATLAAGRHTVSAK